MKNHPKVTLSAVENTFTFATMRNMIWVMVLMSWGYMCAAQATPITIGATVLLPDGPKQERAINISVPAGYGTDDTSRYEVVYLLDGGMDEDYLHLTGLLHYAANEWIGWRKPSIVVGITHRDRKRDMTPPSRLAEDKALLPTSGGGDRMMRYINDTVKAYINSHYRTKGNGVLIGESLAGLLASKVLLTTPNDYDEYIIISPSLWWSGGDVLKLTAAPTGDKRPLVYIGVGKEGKTPGKSGLTMEDYARQLNKKVRQLYGADHVVLDYMPTETHATTGHIGVYAALRQLAALKKAGVK